MRVQLIADVAWWRVCYFLFLLAVASTCLKQVKDLEAKPKLLGAFKPVCQDNGLYAETQCHGKISILNFHNHRF